MASMITRTVENCITCIRRLGYKNSNSNSISDSNWLKVAFCFGFQLGFCWPVRGVVFREIVVTGLEVFGAHGLTNFLFVLGNNNWLE